ncbi:diguanylate phosphodiesterase [Acinetobacter sp. NCu2D-2]|uniref:EAL domain-containing protein n=1 Tax=Acinetobacter sp. NCu2D-2 TaxID=1608473 RepID=UPI0007CDB39F|nr:EAL domain-containing protein [Acinetobacter sp. NCu2D-2]ANF81512.1 diguanylate phosphodiesterase [Acinetobacter sp. NCu2D-2]
MGSIEVRNPLLSKKLKRTETRLLIIDDNQIRFNQIQDLLTSNEYQVDAILLDDLQNFEKQLNFHWDLIIFGRAYDLKYEQALSIVRLSNQPNLPIILLKPDDYQAEQYATYVHKGIYDILNLDFPERFYVGLVRALSFSRMVQTQQHLMDELETAQSQAQVLVDESHKAVAVIQEGIHLEANDDYLKLFGITSGDDIIGLPLLDVIQPENLNEFKTRLKKASQGQFDLGGLEVCSNNPSLSQPNPLKIEFLASNVDEDAIQITIETANAVAQNAPTEKTGKVSTAQQIKREISKESAPVNALVLFTLANIDSSVLNSNWSIYTQYFKAIKTFLKEQTHVPLFKFDDQAYVGLFQADSKEVLNSKLISLGTLAKPQLLNINNNSYPLQLRMGYTILDSDLRDDDHLNQYVNTAFSTALPQDTASHEFSLDIPTSVQNTVQPSIDFSVSDQPITATPAPTTTSSILPTSPVSILFALRQCLERGEIHLKYQQLYDKEDSDLYVYEVTSGFIYENKWHDISSLRDLAEDDELSIKLDRWILVESCKQLHNFITQYPQARLIVNLNKAVLFNDRTFPEFISKLITIIRSQLDHPLTLQFAEEDLLMNREDAQKYIRILRDHGARVSIRDFGYSMYSEMLLKDLDINGLTLHQKLTTMLKNEAEAQELQEKITKFNEIKTINIMLRELDDMTLFANAWNVDVRYIQGAYFQKPLDQLIDIQEH